MSQIYPPFPPQAPLPGPTEGSPRSDSGAPESPPAKKVSWWHRLLPVAVAAVALIGGILAGVAVFHPHTSRQTSSASADTTTPAAGEQGRGGPDGRGIPDGPGFGGGGFDRNGARIRGTISSISGRTLTVSTPFGQTVTVLMADATTVTETTQTSSGQPQERKLSVADLAQGDEVFVLGSIDGNTVTALRIQRGYLFPRFGPGRGPQQHP